MKIYFIIIMIPISIALIGQNDHISNSYKRIYDTRYPALKYYYDSSTQTHDYSGNWDFDGDKISDSLSFVGNGGAHLYFHLRLRISSELKTRNFEFLVLDFPVLDSIDHFRKVYGKTSIFPVFVVHDFNNDGRMDIYFNTDINFAAIPSRLKRKGVTSGNLLITYEKKDIVIKNFPGVN